MFVMNQTISELYKSIRSNVKFGMETFNVKVLNKLCTENISVQILDESSIAVVFQITIKIFF